MPNGKPDLVPTPKTRKARTRNKNAYLARVAGDSKPRLVISYTQADAMKAIITLTPASHEDLMAAGKSDYAIIDATIAKSGQSDLAGTDPV